MNLRKRQPSHPGGILKRNYLEPLGLSVSDVAKAVHSSRKTISKLVNEKGSITPAMALRLAISLDTSPELWMNLQQNYDLWFVRKQSKIWKKIQKLAA